MRSGWNDSSYSSVDASASPMLSPTRDAEELTVGAVDNMRVEQMNSDHAHPEQVNR